ncbi:hypothetical protein L873DRAFT_1799347 [Choiromyces venosus 120613-1]|uniref:Uncharacterized protein n=1 Tax=Choiromyces venosus 120613-1 TaxID=1336337 RepID=A0A3N4K1M7_9PEZI|nr:hypothetical protein L873DRAFT_1799347 [Choiromyces venosus 120613-1]
MIIIVFYLTQAVNTPPFSSQPNPTTTTKLPKSFTPEHVIQSRKNNPSPPENTTRDKVGGRFDSAERRYTYIAEFGLAQ